MKEWDGQRQTQRTPTTGDRAPGLLPRGPQMAVSDCTLFPLQSIYIACQELGLLMDVGLMLPCILLCMRVVELGVWCLCFPVLASDFRSESLCAVPPISSLLPQPKLKTGCENSEPRFFGAPEHRTFLTRNEFRGLQLPLSHFFKYSFPSGYYQGFAFDICFISVMALLFYLTGREGLLIVYQYVLFVKKSLMRLGSL